MDTQDKKAVSFWMKQSTLQQIDSWLSADNCRSRSEFIEKAIRFYIGYLTTDNVSDYLSDALVAALQGTLADSSNRLRAMLFKWCVELNMACHTIAAHFRADEVDRRALRAFAVQEVRETNGQISFDHALDVQKEPSEPDDEWQD